MSIITDIKYNTRYLKSICGVIVLMYGYFIHIFTEEQKNRRTEEEFLEYNHKERDKQI